MLLRRWSLVWIVVATFALGLGGNTVAAGVQNRMMLAAIDLPPGFAIALYADELPGARSMAVSPGGVLFVGTRQSGRVYAVVDQNGDGRADRVHILAEELNMPNGVAFMDGDLYVAEVDRILRFRRIESHLDRPPAPEVIFDRLPKAMLHGWRTLRAGPDGRLYVTLSAPCDVCREEGAMFAAIARLNRDGSGFEVVLRGVRHSMGMDWHPGSRALWFTDTAPRQTDPGPVPDELNRADARGLHFGFPHCYGGVLADQHFGGDHACSEFTAPVLRLDPGVNAAGLRFYRGRMFPPGYNGRIMIAEQGALQHPDKSGFRIMQVTLRGEQVVGYDLFAKGWLLGGLAWGRPVDVEIMADGSLLVSDDLRGAIYRITYSAVRPEESADRP
ncbi:PQQ-dependent sugar dehydrogenase [Desulfatitalea alkaliphila]|uniref:PQQ-dependent sugar dehydrogenase n=1 Tax=Desulfatitalea alkaliphila TaxID=2929485 RepID=A0AA41R4J0_9BACT|nr:PQQ-dependent sugar dehydrogenase [Desulfatitalea alkaliphila]MCJ8500666.1 PQQ-dependent sugar dehydrogenase [Desulfatitalea alkaliphila]